MQRACTAASPRRWAGLPHPVVQVVRAVLGAADMADAADQSTIMTANASTTATKTTSTTKTALALTTDAWADTATTVHRRLLMMGIRLAHHMGRVVRVVRADPVDRGADRRTHRQ